MARYEPNYNIVDNAQDPLRGLYRQAPGSIMGGDAESEATYIDMLMGRPDAYGQGGLDPGPMFPDQTDPQDFINMQLAGDIVPMMLDRDKIDSLAAAPYPNRRGAASINTLGGSSSPYLDLLNILAFPSGRSMAPPIRR